MTSSPVVAADPRPVVMVGFFADLAADLLATDPGRRLLVIEEPDLLRDVAAFRDRHPRVDVRAGRYQQSEEAVAVGRAWARTEPVGAVVAGREYATVPAAVLADALGLGGPGLEAARLCTDKLATRTALAGTGLTRGRFAAVSSVEDVVRFFDARPVVLKPRSRHASIGVVRIDRAADAASAWSRARATEKVGGVPDERLLRWDYLVEEMVDGAEFSVESLVVDGRPVFSNVTRKQMAGGQGHFSPLGHVLPAPLTAHDASRLEDAERELLTHLGVRAGLTHSEWILTEDGPHLVECALRYPGGRLARLIELVYGFNLAEAWLAVLQGRAPAVLEPDGVGGVQYLFAGTPLPSADLDALCGELPGVLEVTARPTPLVPGDRPRHSFDRIGHVITRANSHADLAARMDDVAARLGLGPVGVGRRAR